MSVQLYMSNVTIWRSHHRMFMNISSLLKRNQSLYVPKTKSTSFCCGYYRSNPLNSATRKQPFSVLLTVRTPLSSSKYKKDTLIYRNFTDSRYPYSNLSFSLLVESLKIYKKKYNNLLVTNSFVIPHDDEWPKEVHGVPLGQEVHYIRKLHKSRKLPVKEREELDSIGFIWHAMAYRYERVLRALKHFKDIHGHCKVHQLFTIPTSTPQWPKELWGYRLGSVIRNIRSSHSRYEPIREAIAELGYDMTPSYRPLPFKDVKQALMVFHKQFGHFNVPQRFVIPSFSEGNEFRYPAIMHGCEFGRILFGIRQGLIHQDYLPELEAMGVSLQSQRYNRFCDFLQALRNYHLWVNDGHLSPFHKSSKQNTSANNQMLYISHKFVIPSDERYFTPQQFGMKLGNRWGNLLHHFVHMEFHDHLIKEGFLTEAMSQNIKQKYIIYQETLEIKRNNSLRSKDEASTSDSNPGPLEIGSEVTISSRRQKQIKKKHDETLSLTASSQNSNKRNKIKKN